MNKNKRYRLRLVSEGKCPHCGKPCAPYYECEERKEYKRQQYGPRKYITKPDDARLLPRGKKRLWTETDDATLRAMLDRSEPLAQICGTLGRKPLAISARARKLGLQGFPKCEDLLIIASRL